MTGSFGLRLLAAVTVCLAVLAAGVWALSASVQWSVPVNLSESEVFTEDASIAADSQGRMHVVWSEGARIVHRYRLEEGWSAPVTVATGFAPALAAGSDGQLHLVFVNRFADVDDVYYVSWQDGSGWELPVNVSDGVERSSSPSLAIASDGSRAVAWGSRSGNLDLIYVAVSDDGVQWASGPVPHAFGVRPKVAIGDGDLMVAWHGPYDTQGSAAEVFFSRKSNHQWTLPLDVSASPEVDSMLASLMFEAGQAFLAWQEDLLSGSAVFTSVEDAGVWSLPHQRSGEEEAYAPALVVGSDGGHLAWTTDSGVQYVRWEAPSGVWQPIEEVATEQAGARDVRITLDGSPSLVWLAEAGINNDDVYYSTRGAEPTVTPSATAIPTASQTAPPVASATPTLTRTLMPTLTCTPTATLQHQSLLLLPIICAASLLTP